VLAGLLGDQPELALVAKAVGGTARIELVEDRLAIVSTVVALRPTVLILPPFDADRTSTAPLILRVRREAPGVAVLVLACHPAGAGQPLLRAVQAGAHVVAGATARELEDVLVGLLRPGSGGA